MKEHRIKHNSIVIGDSIYHIGGETIFNKESKNAVEKWTYKDGSFDKELVQSLADEVEHQGGTYDTLFLQIYYDIILL